MCGISFHILLQLVLVCILIMDKLIVINKVSTYVGKKPSGEWKKSKCEIAVNLLGYMCSLPSELHTYARKVHHLGMLFTQIPVATVCAQQGSV